MAFDSKLALPDLILRIFTLLCSIVYYGLDITLINQNSDRISIARDALNSYINFTNIGVAVIVLGAIFMVCLLALIFFGLIPDNTMSGLFLFVFSLGLVLFEITRDAILYKYISCFNFSSHYIIKARVSFRFIFLVSYVAICVLSLFKEGSKGSRIVRIIHIVLSVLISGALIALNILILVSLKAELSRSIGPEYIDMALLTRSDFKKVENGSYIKDSYYDYRVISQLSNITKSNETKLAYKDCDYKCDDKVCHNECTNYYWRFLTVKIKCKEETKFLYKECETANNIIIRVRYLDEGSYPLFGCGVENMYNCTPGCPYLVSSYQLYLVQQYSSNQLELAWTGLCNCVDESPRFVLYHDKNMNVCSAANRLLEKNFLYLICFLFLNRNLNIIKINF